MGFEVIEDVAEREARKNQTLSTWLNTRMNLVWTFCLAWTRDLATAQTAFLG